MSTYVTHYRGFVIVDEGRPRGKLAARGAVVLTAEWCEAIEDVIDDWWAAQPEIDWLRANVPSMLADIPDAGH